MAGFAGKALFVAVSALAFFSAAAAESVAFGDAEAAKAEFVAAAEQAKARADQRWAFTLTYTDLPENKTYRVRFDPRLPAGERWTPIEPAADALSKEERKVLKNISRNDDADDGLVYDGLSDFAADAEVLRADAREAAFRIAVDDPEMAPEMKAALSATATLDRAAGHVTAIEIISTKPFKPAPVAKIEKMRQLHRFAPVGPDRLVMLVSAVSEAKGKAMFKAFDEKADMAYSDFEAVDAPPRAPKPGSSGD